MAILLARIVLLMMVIIGQDHHLLNAMVIVKHAMAVAQINANHATHLNIYQMDSVFVQMANIWMEQHAESAMPIV